MLVLYISLVNVRTKNIKEDDAWSLGTLEELPNPANHLGQDEMLSNGLE